MSKKLSALLRTGSSTPLTIASSTQLGGVKVDGSSIMISSSGVISGASTYSLPVSTSVILGGVKQGSNVAIAGDGTISVAAPYSLPVSTSVILGGVKQGSNVAIAGDGTISVAAPYSLPVSTSVILGGVKQGSNVAIAGDGTISVAAPYSLTAATTNALGGVIIPVVGTSGITNTSGTIGIATASASQLGGVKQGSNVAIAGDGTISVAAPYSLTAATTSALGGVIIPVVGTSGITNTSGTIGIATASASQLGGVKVDGNNIEINGSGVISVVEKTTALSSTATTLTIDLTTTTTSTIIITCDTTASQAKTFNFTGTPATMTSANIFSINVIVKNNVAIASLAWQRAGVASNIKWPNGVIPPATLTVIGTGGYDVWTFFTTDAGVTFAGSLAMYGVR